MKGTDLVESYPCLYHATGLKNWSTIQRHGLLSTSSLLDLFEVNHDRRVRLEYQRRPNSELLYHPERGKAILRDNRPISNAKLKRCLEDDLTPSDWYAILNRRVFFWTTCERLRRFLRVYRETEQLVIVVPTERMVEIHRDQIELTTINTGATRDIRHTRGRSTFTPLSDFDLDQVRRARRQSRDKVVAEVAVVDSIPTLTGMASVAVRISSGGTTEVIWQQRKAEAPG